MPTAAVATEPFLDEALEQARLLGMPDYRMVLVPHPVQLLSAAELRALVCASCWCWRRVETSWALRPREVSGIEVGGDVGGW